MTPWQRRARLGAAAFAVAVAAAVYLGLRDRAPVPPPARVERLDPAALLEVEGGDLRQDRAGQPVFTITAERTLLYRDGSTRQLGVRIDVPREDGRDYVITARDGEAGQDRTELQLSGDVRLAASDGFTLVTDRASFDRETGVVRAPGTVAFERGRLTGSGTGATYDERRDVLEVTESAHVRLADEYGRPATQFTSDAAALDRARDRLSLTGRVHALRGGRTIEADRGVARLSPSHDTISFLALRGRARVGGGEGSVASMRAREIDLAYAEDGERLEGTALRGEAAIALAAGGDGIAGRRLAGESLDLDLAPDGTLTRVAGAGGVQFDMPPANGAPAGVVRAETLAGTGAGGMGLTDVRFAGDVEYIERSPDRPGRSVRAEALHATLEGEGIGSAVFAGRVVFEGGGFHASGGEARYRPAEAALHLVAGAANEDPRVRDDRMTIGAQTIDLGLDTERLTARGTVRTAIGAAGEAGGLPGLLQPDVPVHVTAGALDYEGASGLAVYTGAAVLWQDDTTMRADRIALDPERGRLVATGTARSSSAFETGRLDGQAHEIAYDDAGRMLTYTASPDTPGGAAGLARVHGPAGDLQARRIVVGLAEAGGRVARIEADAGVHVRTGRRVATGVRLVYTAADDRYEVTGTTAAPARATGACGDTLGRTLIFFASTDRMVVDGHERMRTETTSRASCRESQVP